MSKSMPFSRNFLALVWSFYICRLPSFASFFILVPTLVAHLVRCFLSCCCGSRETWGYQDNTERFLGSTEIVPPGIWYCKYFIYCSIYSGVFIFYSGVSLLLSSSTRRRLYPRRSSGQAVVTGVVPSPPRYVPSSFIAHRVHNSHCSSIFIECC